MIADLFRLYSAATAAVLVAVCIWCMFRPMLWQQRTRFGALLLLGVVITGGQIESLGGPINWRMPILAVAVTAAVVSSAAFLRRRAGGE